MDSIFFLLYMVFDSISYHINEALLIHRSSNAFAFGDFNIHRKNWQICSGGTDRPVDKSILVELIYLVMVVRVTGLK